jgi:hypothetical protein
LLNDEYPYVETIHRIRHGIIKLKEDPCNKCVVGIVCDKSRGPGMCDDKEDYDYLLDWICVNKPDYRIWIKDEHGVYVQLSDEQDQVWKKHILETFIDFEKSDISKLKDIFDTI